MKDKTYHDILRRRMAMSQNDNGYMRGTGVYLYWQSIYFSKTDEEARRLAINHGNPSLHNQEGNQRSTGKIRSRMPKAHKVG